jgi:hypothetical protein
MIAIACDLLVVTCIWFGFNAIIVTHLFELTFEFAHNPIDVVGSVPTRCYETNPGWMLLTYLWLRQFQTNQWLDLIIVSASRVKESVFCLVSLLLMDPTDKHRR